MIRHLPNSACIVDFEEFQGPLGEILVKIQVLIATYGSEASAKIQKSRSNDGWSQPDHDYIFIQKHPRATPIQDFSSSTNGDNEVADLLSSHGIEI